jgi:type I restriction enzyme S subunit
MLYQQEKSYRLKDFCEVGDGTHSSIAREESGVMYLTSKNFKPTGLDLSKVDYISEENYKKHFERSKSALVKPANRDIVFGIIGTIGTPYVVKKQDRFGISSSVGILRPNAEIDSYFLFYFMTSSSFQMSVESMKSGAAQGFLSLEMIKNLPLVKIELQTQKKIAAILSAYDDLIENNKRRIAILENMAEKIYREWFVRFRFPGYQTAEFEKGIPKGWELMPFSQAVEINPTERPEKDELKPYVGMEALSTNSMFFKPTERRKGNSGSKFRNGDTLFPRITPCLENGKRGYVMTLEMDEVAIGSTEFIVMREKLLTSEFIYLLCCFEPFRTHAEISMVGASGRQRVSENCFSFFLVAIPPKEILDRFTEIVRPMFESVKVLSNQNSYLEMTRDNLLPRLISGKLSVEDLKIQFPPSMQENSAA